MSPRVPRSDGGEGVPFAPGVAFIYRRIEGDLK